VRSRLRRRRCGCAPPKQYVIVDTANGKVTRLDNAQDRKYA
jgi:hypothetical protein